MIPIPLRRLAIQWVIVGLWLGCVGIEGLPLIRFSGVFITNKNEPNPGLLNGTYSSQMALLSGSGFTNIKWRFTESVVFKNGRFELMLPYPSEGLLQLPAGGGELPADGFQFDYDTVSLSVFPLVSGALAERFRLLSYPFSVTTKVADYALSASAEEMEAVGDLSVHDVTVNQTMSVFGVGLAVSSKSVSIGGGGSPVHRLSVAGLVNAKGYYVNGIPLSDTLPWQAPIGASYIRSSPGHDRIGIGLKYPLSTLHVGGSGTVNATAFLAQGQPYTYTNQWRSLVGGQENDLTATVYVPDDLMGVGIGIYRPMERLELDGALRLSSDLVRSHQAGVIQYGLLTSPLWPSRSRRDFQGLVASGNQLVWKTLLGYDREPRPNRLSYFKPIAEADTALPMIGATGLEWSSTLQALGLGMTPDATFSLRPLASQSRVPLWSMINSQSGGLYPVFSIDSTGNIGIGTSSPMYTLDVDGILNVQDVYENEAPYRLSRSKGTYFQRNANSDIFYLHGNVGIGRPDPTSRLDISAINVERGVTQENPALSISMRSAGSVIRYTMGVDLGSQETFRVEKGDILGSKTPLFVAQKDRFGVGTDTPYANLTVSGNGGIVLGGGFPNGTPMTPWTEESYFFWYPRKNVFRAMGSSVEQTEADMGLHSTAMGYDTTAKGNFSLVLGGQNNRVEGAYASTVGGRNVMIADTSDFSLGLGTNVSVLHHGVWAWGDRNGGAFASQRDNQWVIRAGGGVGIGTTKTAISDAYGSNERPISLAVGGGLVTPYLFLPGSVGDLQYGVTAFLVDPTQNAQALVNDMVASGRLSAFGDLLQFDRQASFLYDTGPYATNAEIKTIINRLVDRPILRLVGQTQDRVVVYQSGAVVLGSEFAEVPGLMLKGMVGVATTTPQADIHMVLPMSSGGVSLNRAAIWVATMNSVPTQPILVVDEYGNVGYRQLPDFRPYGSSLQDPNPEKKRAYLFASSLQVSAMDWWNGMTLTNGAFAGDPWMSMPLQGVMKPLVFPSANLSVVRGLSVIPRTGNVGIGTPSPSALLTLSNRSSVQNTLLSLPVRWPTLAFDWDGVDRMSIGRRLFAPSTLLFYAGGSQIDDAALGNASLVITPTQVGIKTIPQSGVVLDVDGVLVLRPSANASVSAVRIGSGPMVVPSAPLLSPLLLGVSRVDVANFSVGGVLQDWADGQNGSVVRFSDLGGGLYSYTGIGRTDPAVELDVRGTVRVDALMATSATFSVVTASTPVGFLELGEPAAFLSVASDRLVVQYGSNQVDLSAVMTQGTSLWGGPLGIFADTSVGLPPFAGTEMAWKPDRDDVLNAPGQWSVTGSMSLVMPSVTRALSTQWIPTMTINTGFSHHVSLTRGPFLSDSFGYQLTHSGVTLSNVVDTGVVGWNVVVTFNPTATLSSGVVGVGLNVDLTQAVAQTVGVRGEKIAAVFMPVPGQPGVGIGTSYPKATLDVKGSMVADRFIIGSELSLVTMNVGASYLDLTHPQGVGIGVSSPMADLDINGAARVVGLMRVKRGVVAPNLSMVTAPFIVANDRVGMGMTTPVSALHTQHLINALTPKSRTGFSYEVHVGDGNIYAASGLTGLTVSLRSQVDKFGYTSQPVNLLGVYPLSSAQVPPVAYGVRLNATGLSVASTPLNPSPSPGLTGLLITMPTQVSAKDRLLAATFLNTTGGVKVGIGLTNPSEALEVAGDIKVDSFDLSLVSTRLFPIFGARNMVVLNQMNVLGPVLLSSIKVNRTVTANQLTVLAPWDVPSLVLWPQTAVMGVLTVSDPVVRIASINALAGSLQVVVASVNRVGPLVDTTVSGTDALKLGDGVLSSLRVDRMVTASSLSIPNRLSVANQTVGIGGEAGSWLHVRQMGTLPYAPATVNTWATVHIQHPTTSRLDDSPIGSGIYAAFPNGQGAGVVAYRTTTLTAPDRTDHALLFLTTGLGVVPTDAMRVLASGQVQMGALPAIGDTSLSAYALLVSGNVMVSAVRGSALFPIQTSSLVFAGSVATVSATTQFTHSYFSPAMTARWLSMASQNTLINPMGLSHVAVASPGSGFPVGSFVFTNAANQQANLGNAAFVGDRYSLLVYHHATGRLTNVSPNTMWVDSTQWRVTVNMTTSGSEVTSGIRVVSRRPVQTSGAGLMVRTSVAPRDVLQAGVTLSAMSLGVTGNGRGNGAVYRALAVDVSLVPTRSYSGLTLQYGAAHAALFQPGRDAQNAWLLADRWSSVGLDQPAMIRIKGDPTLADPLWTVESSAARRGNLWVSKDISVYVTNSGTRSSMESSFAVPALMGVLGQGELLRFRDNGGASWVLTESQSSPQLLLGVTQAGPETLQVNGTLRGNESGIFDAIDTDLFQHAVPQGITILRPDSALDTRVGLGVSNPTYGLEVGRQVTGSMIGTTPDLQVVHQLTMGMNFSAYPGNVKLKGLDIGMAVSSNIGLDNQVVLSSGASALLLGIDATKAMLTGQARVIGLSVSMNQGSGRVALLNGGGVGIGTLTPRAMLEVAGTMSGHSFYQSSLGNWQLDRATANTLGVLAMVNVPSLTVGRSVSTNVLRILAANFVLPSSDDGEEFKVEDVFSDFAAIPQLSLSNTHQIESPDGSRLGPSFPSFSLKGSVWGDGTLTAGWVTLNQFNTRDDVVVQAPMVTLNHSLRTPRLMAGVLGFSVANPLTLGATSANETAMMVSGNALYIKNNGQSSWLNLSNPNQTNGVPNALAYYGGWGDVG